MVLGDAVLLHTQLDVPAVELRDVSKVYAGGVEAVFSALAIRDQIAPPTINIFNQDPRCDLDYVPNEARSMKIDAAMSNSFAFGGLNAVLVAKKYS